MLTKITENVFLSVVGFTANGTTMKIISTVVQIWTVKNKTWLNYNVLPMGTYKRMFRIV